MLHLLLGNLNGTVNTQFKHQEVSMNILLKKSNNFDKIKKKLLIDQPNKNIIIRKLHMENSNARVVRQFLLKFDVLQKKRENFD